MSNNNLQNIVTNYNDAINSYPTQTDTIFSSKYSELLGDEGAAAEQIKAIREERKVRDATNKKTALDIHKDRLQQEHTVRQTENSAFQSLDNHDRQLADYMLQKADNTQNLIDTLQDSIYTRDKTIYLNNSDAHDKTVLIKTLLTLFLLVAVLSAIFLLHMFNILKTGPALIAAVVVTVVFVYKIIRTYYWREVVHDMDVASDTVSASLRALVGDKNCPTCDMSYCKDHLKKMYKKNKRYCVNNTSDTCCNNAQINVTRQIPPDNIAIVDNSTDMNLL